VLPCEAHSMRMEWHMMVSMREVDWPHKTWRPVHASTTSHILWLSAQLDRLNLLPQQHCVIVQLISNLAYSQTLYSLKHSTRIPQKSDYTVSPKTCHLYLVGMSSNKYLTKLCIKCQLHLKYVLELPWEIWSDKCVVSDIIFISYARNICLQHKCKQ